MSLTAVPELNVIDFYFFMTVFNSTKRNMFHYLTKVTFRRVPIFKSEKICQFFTDALRETKENHLFKLVGYVIMPDHIHLILNPIECDISLFGKALKGKSARKIIDWLKLNDFQTSLKKLALPKTQKRNHSFAVWQKKITSIDLESDKFIRQKLNYIHLNPIRAKICEHPAKWKWPSYHAYLPHKPGEVPIEIDLQGYWKDEEFERYEAERENKKMVLSENKIKNAP
ncbi:MAG: REP-associated tyrosine transposase [Aridibacter sp.]